jgi:peroxiredoxin
MHHPGVSAKGKAASGPTPAGCSSAGTGQLLPDAALPTSSGGTLSLDWYRGRRNLVVVLLGAGEPGDEVARLLLQLVQVRAALQDEEAEVLVVATGETREPVHGPEASFTVLIDPDASFHRCLDAVDAAGNDAPAVIITDRYREIYHVFRPAESPWPPTAEAVVSWLVFMNIQCPECGVPEW